MRKTQHNWRRKNKGFGETHRHPLKSLNLQENQENSNVKVSSTIESKSKLKTQRIQKAVTVSQMKRPK